MNLSDELKKYSSILTESSGPITRNLPNKGNKMNVPQKVIGLVPGSVAADWHQHANGGGWVYKTAKVAKTAYVGVGAAVYDKARAFGDARVYGDARVSGNARVYGSARIFGFAQVADNAQVYGDARVDGNAWVFGNAQVFGHAQVFGDAWEQSPLQIQGSRHFVTLCSLEQIAIGCHVHDFAYWKEHFKAIGRKERYSAEEVKEYRHHIGTCIAYAKSMKVRAESKVVSR